MICCIYYDASYIYIYISLWVYDHGTLGFTYGAPSENIVLLFKILSARD